MFALLDGSYYDDIQIGKTRSSFQPTYHWLDNLTELYRHEYDDKFPDITLPLMEVGLEQIYLTLRSYDDLLGTNFVEHVTSCYNEHELCKPDNLCNSCDERNEIFKQLGWTETTD